VRVHELATRSKLGNVVLLMTVYKGKRRAKTIKRVGGSVLYTHFDDWIILKRVMAVGIFIQDKIAVCILSA